ncbi:MAG: helix-turn-helix transcriptional regulator [Peptostreptococcaceae bacterium]|nr:helix-turn-helix transcriptional regulator [Peptostreptococcaceae bacterium]
MVNKVEFEVAVLRKGLKKKEVAKLIGISESALYKKLNGKSDFIVSEVQRLFTILDLENQTATDIFFRNMIPIQKKKQ